MVKRISAAQTALNEGIANAERAAKRLRDAGYRHKSARNAGQPTGPWFRIQNNADDPTVAQIDIYDEIDWYWGVTAANFRSELKALPEDVATIDLHINSPGGDVYEAIAIMNSLRQHKARVVTTVDGYAASSAGFIAVGASDELIVAENAEVMAHLPWAYMVGDAADMRKMADDLDRIGTNIASIFAARAGGTVEEWMAVLTAETWWSAGEAVDAGIADSVLAAPKRADTGGDTKDRFDLSVFNHAGRSNAPAPRTVQAYNQTPLPVVAEVNRGKEPIVATLNEGLAELLGVDTDASDETILAAVAAATQKADEDSGNGAGTAPAEPTLDQVAAVAAKHGLSVMSETDRDQLIAQAKAGAEAREQQIREQDDTVIRDAKAAGKITPASEAEWRKSLANDRAGITALLATLPVNTAVAVYEVGHGIDNEATAVDADKAGVFARITGTTFGKDA